MEYPEHDKLHAIKAESQIIGEFLDWLGESPYTLCEFNKERWLGEGGYAPTGASIETILAAFFDIDLDKLETEKREMLAELRGNTPAARAELGLPALETGA